MADPELKRPFICSPSNPDWRRIAATMYDYVCDEVEGGRELVIMVADPVKSRDQEEKYHAIIGEIAATELVYGKKLNAETWKRLLIDAFKHATVDDPELSVEWGKFGSVELVPALNHPGFVVVGEQSRNFGRKLASAFIEWLLAFQAGAERGRQ